MSMRRIKRLNDLNQDPRNKKNQLCDLSHAHSDSSHVIRVMLFDLHLHIQIQKYALYVWFESDNMWFESNLYDLSDGCCDSNHNSIKTIHEHPVILIRIVKVCNSNHTSTISTFVKCEVFLRFQLCHDLNHS